METKHIISGYEPLTVSELEAINLIRSYGAKAREMMNRRNAQLGACHFFAFVDLRVSDVVFPNEVQICAYYYYGIEAGAPPVKDMVRWKRNNAFEAYAEGELKPELDELMTVLEKEVNKIPEEDEELKLENELRKADSQ